MFLDVIESVNLLVGTFWLLMRVIKGSVEKGLLSENLQGYSKNSE